MASLESMPWAVDWARGIALVVANLVMHVVGLSLIGAFVLGDSASILRNRTASVDFVMVVGVTLCSRSFYMRSKPRFGGQLMFSWGVDR